MAVDQDWRYTYINDRALRRIQVRADLLICGSRGYGPLRPVMLGSVTRRVVAKAHCPVVVVPRGSKAALQGLVGESSGAAAP